MILRTAPPIHSTRLSSGYVPPAKDLEVTSCDNTESSQFLFDKRLK